MIYSEFNLTGRVTPTKNLTVNLVKFEVIYNTLELKEFLEMLRDILTE